MTDSTKAETPTGDENVDAELDPLNRVWREPRQFPGNGPQRQGLAVVFWSS